MTEYMQFSPAVQSALAEGRPVLALESTVITHGLPHPQNLEIARELEQTTRDNGAEPATLILLRGKIQIGLEEKDFTQLEELSQKAQTDKKLLRKLAERDIAVAIANKWSGGTTVSATLHLAHLAGIKVFATGGIGGVHRNWQQSLDISADLAALTRHPVIIVTAGCKAILDIPATLEQLETQSVPVLGWQTDICPAFYTRDSGIPIDRIDSAEAVARVFSAQTAMQRALGGCEKGSALVIMNPVPKKSEIPVRVIEPYIEKALEIAERKNITGKAITPFLLQQVAELTGGEALATNLALLKNNVMVGSQIAAAISKQNQSG